MKILIMEIKSLKNFCMKYFINTLQKMGHDVIHKQYDLSNFCIDKQVDAYFDKNVAGENYDIVFSFNYVPVLSNNCKRYNIKYVSWVYDSPHVFLFSYTIINECNYVFLFDKAMYLELKRAGINTVYYMPLAADTDEYDKFEVNYKIKQKYKADVSFVGSLYDDPSHNVYRRLEDLPPYLKGYLDAIIKVQSKVYGYFFLEEQLTDEMVKEIKKYIPYSQLYGGVENEKYIYANYVMGLKVSYLERCDIMKRISEKFSMKIYTRSDTKQYPNILNMGSVDYYKEMPYVFKCTKINLNVSAKSIRTGIPLRAFDIMGCGGFLMSNYQEDFFDYFTPGEDFEIYDNISDLEEKIGYYLEHDEEREQIALNGYNKVKKYHSFETRIKEMLSIIKEN